MTRRRKPPPPKRRWQALQPATIVPPSPEQIEALRAEAERLGIPADDVDRHLEAAKDVWKNDRYTVIVTRHAEEGWVTRLSIRRNDRAAEPFPWRDIQRIKNQLAGADAEAVELYPAESRLVDTANQRWLWCLPPGDRVPIGFDSGRVVSGAEEAERVGARQAPLEEDAP